MFMREATVDQAVEGEISELVRRNVVGLRANPNDGRVAADNINSLVQRVSESAVQEIDQLINELQISRERLHLEGEKVQRVLVEYATLSQSMLQMTKLVTENLSQLKRVPDAARLAEGA
jgi:hypothetical protein